MRVRDGWWVLNKTARLTLPSATVHNSLESRIRKTPDLAWNQSSKELFFSSLHLLPHLLALLNRDLLDWSLRLYFISSPGNSARQSSLRNINLVFAFLHLNYFHFFTNMWLALTVTKTSSACFGRHRVCDEAKSNTCAPPNHSYYPLDWKWIQDNAMHLYF